MEIEGIIQLCCIRRALEAKFITLQALIEFLATQSVYSENLALAFLALIQTQTDGFYYTNQGIHILKALPNELLDPFAAIYLLSCGKVSVPDTRSGSTPITQLLVSATAKLFNESEWSRPFKVMTGKLLETDQDRALAAKAGYYVQTWPNAGHVLRQLNWLQSMPSAALINSIAQDSYEQLIGVVGHIPDILKRCELLKYYTPNYWREVTEPIYRRLFQELYQQDAEKTKLAWINTDTTHIQRIIALFPTLPYAQWRERSNLSHKLWTYPRFLQAYILGFPFHEHNLDSFNIDQGLKTLASSSIEDYVATLEEDTKNRYRLRLPSVFGAASMPVNTENTLAESIWSYSCFDRCIISTEGKDYAFTREEFAKLIETRKHFYTNTEIPTFTINRLKSKVHFAMAFHFPKAAPIRDLLRQVSNNDLRCEEQEQCIGIDLQQFIHQVFNQIDLETTMQAPVSVQVVNSEWTTDEETDDSQDLDD